MISVREVKAISKNTSNWKAPEIIDRIQGHWIKRYGGCYVRIAAQFNSLLNSDHVTVLENIEKRNKVDNYRPISCLPLTL